MRKVFFYLVGIILFVVGIVFLKRERRKKVIKKTNYNPNANFYSQGATGTILTAGGAFVTGVSASNNFTSGTLLGTALSASGGAILGSMVGGPVGALIGATAGIATSIYVGNETNDQDETTNQNNSLHTNSTQETEIKPNIENNTATNENNLLHN